MTRPRISSLLSVRVWQIAFLSVVWPVLASAQPSADTDVEQKVYAITGLQIRMNKLLPMIGKDEAFLSANHDEARHFTRASFEKPHELASGPDASLWYRRAVTLNRKADDMIAGGNGETGRKPWKQFTPEDLAQKILATRDFCVNRKKCMPEEVSDMEKMISWMRRDVEKGDLTLPDFVDRVCRMMDRFYHVVTTEPLPADWFFTLHELSDREPVRMLQVRTEKLMRLTFQKRAFLHAAKKPVEAVNALVHGMETSGESPAAEKALQAAVRQLIAIADDILAGGDGTTGKKPWKQFTPEDMSRKVKRMGPIAGHETGFFLVDTTFRQMALDVNAGKMSVGDLVDTMYLRIDQSTMEQRQPATSPATP